MKITLLRWLYNVLFTIALPFDGLRLLLRSHKMPGANRGWCQRLGQLPTLAPDKPVIWLHAVSLGEVNLSKPLIEGLLQYYPFCQIVVTTTTLTGAQAVKSSFADKVIHHYFPYDHPLCSKKFIKNVKPKMLIIMETELWPNHLRNCLRYAIPVYILNARLSEKSCRAYRRVQSWLISLWPAVTHIGVQTQQDKDNFLALGCPANKITVTGNLKYDHQFNPALLRQAKVLREQWGQQRPVWIAASTHDGEEEIILDTYLALKKLCPDCLLILVPRHPQRFAHVAQLIQRHSLNSVRRTEPGKRCRADTEVYLIDTVGELTLFYAASDVAFVGGSLVPIGGHNVIEAAMYDCAIITGPHTFNFKQIMHDFVQAGAAIRIENPHELCENTHALFIDTIRRQHSLAQAKMLLENNHGALAKDLAIIDSH